MSDYNLLSVSQMYAADAAAIASGVSGEKLMEAAGAAVATAIQQRWPHNPATSQTAVVLCGPGNNGGDGFVAARLLQEAGWNIRLGLLGEISGLKGDAAIMAGRWSGETLPLSKEILDGADLIVDALYGAGLTGNVDGLAGDVLRAVSANPAPCVAVDVPSGLSGDTGKVCGYAASATLTVTFFRAKPGHYLMPGRALRGELVVADIGIPSQVLEKVILPITHDDSFEAMINTPDVWLESYPLPDVNAHKYGRGHVIVDSGGISATGAARMAAMGALRVGAGVVTIGCPKSALTVLAGQLTAIMVEGSDTLDEFAEFLLARKRNVAIMGPGNGATQRTHERTRVALASSLACVLDADALSCFAENPKVLFEDIKTNAVNRGCILTPHSGEFDRLFGEDQTGGEVSKLDRALQAARKSGATIIFKGPDTVIASPDGRAAININGSAWLATAGSGDVLAGLAGGLVAQGMSTFEAACAAVWLHAECARSFGPGLIAEDLPDLLPSQISKLLTSWA